MKEIHSIVEIQRQAWQMSDLGIVPLFEMKAVSSIGTVLIAMDEEDKGIGFIYAFDQIPDIHYSHMMAVLPDWHGKSIGFELKKFHRKIALKKGINYIKWTVDPLLPNNAFLNFAKLGGICNKYYVNYYGNPEDEGVSIYAGLETDRFLVDWRIREKNVDDRMLDYKITRISLDELLKRSPNINTIENDEPISNTDEFEQKSSFSVEIPSNFQELRINHLDKAKLWRTYFRNICIYYFDKGWSVIDYHSYDRVKNYYEFSKI